MAPIPELVLYHSPGCPHCVDFKPTFEQASKRLQASGIKTRMVNVQTNKPTELNEPLQGVPHVVLFHPNGNQVVFNGARSVPGLVNFVNTRLPSSSSLHGGAIRKVPLQGGATERLLNVLHSVQQ